MKELAIISFSIATGVISAVFGLSVVDEPVKYCMVNFPLIMCFIAIVNLLSDRS